VYPLAVLTSQLHVLWVHSENVAAAGEAFRRYVSWLCRLWLQGSLQAICVPAVTEKPDGALRQCAELRFSLIVRYGRGRTYLYTLNRVAS
jgi:hypothetical protein